MSEGGRTMKNEFQTEDDMLNDIEKFKELDYVDQKHLKEELKEDEFIRKLRLLSTKTGKTILELMKILKEGKPNEYK